MAEPGTGAAVGGSEPTGAPPGTAPSPSPPPASPSPSPSPSSPGATPPPPPSPGLAAGAGAPGSPAPAGDQYVGIRDALKGMGLDLGGQFPDDQAALAHLALAYRQGQSLAPLAPHVQSYLQNQQQFQAWLQQQQAQKQAQQAQSWWKAPEWDPRWANMVERDPITQQLRPAAGAPPDVVQKLQAGQAHYRQFLEQFAFDPMKAIGPGVEEAARKIAQEIVQQHLGAHQEQAAARQVLQDNAAWLYAKDAQGQELRDPLTGQPQLSEWGKKFAAHAQDADRLGLKDVKSQYQYAFGMVQRDFLYQQRQAAAAPGAAAATGDAAKDAFLRTAAAAHQPNAAGSINPPAPAGAAPSQNPSLSLKDRLARNLDQAGYKLGTPITGR